MKSKGLVVAIDGPSGAGKSTAGRTLAERLGYTYIDTGAMYRALALKAMRAGVSLDSEEALATLCRASTIELTEGGRGVVLDGEDVTSAIRSPETSRASSLVSVHSGVRTEMVARQREMGREGQVVLDGRDIGTAVFPDAEVKFFLDATPGERAHRRLEELRAAGSEISLETVEEDVRERDYTDTHRAESPLVPAWDALALDTTRLSPEEVLERMLAAVRAREGQPIDLGRLAEEHRGSTRRYLEALRSAALSVGLYRLAAGGEDDQRPHGEEEVYLVLEGRGRFRMGDEDVAVSPGHLLTVPARVEHRFHSVEQDLLLLVFFAPAEGSAEAEAEPPK
jgi:cytidylate kinase